MGTNCKKDTPILGAQTKLRQNTHRTGSGMGGSRPKVDQFTGEGSPVLEGYVSSETAAISSVAPASTIASSSEWDVAGFVSMGLETGIWPQLLWVCLSSSSVVLEKFPQLVSG